MLLKYIEIGCKNLLKSREVFLSNYAFSMVSDHKDSCILKNNSIELHLTQQELDFNRVVNIGFSHENINEFKEKTSVLGLRSSKINDNCERYDGVPFVNIQSPFSHLSHKVYQCSTELESEKQPSTSPISLDIDHVLFCCDTQTAHLHADWYAKMLDLKPYICEVRLSKHFATTFNNLITVVQKDIIL